MNKDDIEQQIRLAINDLPDKESIKRILLFGSYLHGTATSESDVDLLIDFDATTPVGMFKLYDVEQAFSRQLHKKVDLTTPESLDKYIKKQVLAEARPLYER